MTGRGGGAGRGAERLETPGKLQILCSAFPPLIQQLRWIQALGAGGCETPVLLNT